MVKIIIGTTSNISLDESCTGTSVKVRHGKRKIKILKGIDLRSLVEGSLFFNTSSVLFVISLILMDMVGGLYGKVTVQ